MMKQFLAIKKERPDCILFFRMGDFYEMFGDDAVVASKTLNIALTTRDKGSANPIPMCGVPYHSINTYLPRMIKEGHKVAICEQVENPKKAVGIVKRAVVRVVTSGAVTEDSMLEEGSHNFLCAVAVSKKGFGLSSADLSTGLLRVCEFIGPTAMDELAGELSRLEPKQLLVPVGIEEIHATLARTLLIDYAKITEHVEPWTFASGSAETTMLDHFKVASLDGFGLEGMELAVRSAGAVMSYLKDTQQGDPAQIRKVTLHNPTEYMPIDPATQRNLELTKTLIDGSRKGSLLGLMDQTVTAMGARRMKETIVRPLTDVAKIGERLETVREFYNATEICEKIRETLAGVGDMERIAARILSPAPSPRDLRSLCNAISSFPDLFAILEGMESSVAKKWYDGWDGMDDLHRFIDESVSDDPPLLARDGGAVRVGFNEELDELRSIKSDSRKAILALEERERHASGIPTLKIKFNKVYGYFMEVSRRQSENVPEAWLRKQSLVNTERFISPMLKELEEKILTAEEKAVELELELYESITERVAVEIPRAQYMGRLIGSVDCFAALAALARSHGYCEPEINDGPEIRITGGRHPIIERSDLSERFVPNDTLIDNEKRRISILTGPNMAGKSTYMRQVALITLMAQTGSFVPADSATIGVCDRLFTRVGAQDHLQKGQSTFMVEMNETSMILNNITRKSLVILDEIGRGTSTFDGISIAWAVAEFIGGVGARTLFATHYHELTELSDSLDGVVNLSVAVKEWNDEIVFLRKIVEGGADKSYGIQVARLAGLPDGVIERAGEILTQLEANELDATGHPKLKAVGSGSNADPDGSAATQITLFAPYPSEVEDIIRQLKIEDTTPLAALNLLMKLKGKV